MTFRQIQKSLPKWIEKWEEQHTSVPYARRKSLRFFEQNVFGEIGRNRWQKLADILKYMKEDLEFHFPPFNCEWIKLLSQWSPKINTNQFMDFIAQIDDFTVHPEEYDYSFSTDLFSHCVNLSPDEEKLWTSAFKKLSEKVEKIGRKRAETLMFKGRTNPIDYDELFYIYPPLSLFWLDLFREVEENEYDRSARRDLICMLSINSTKKELQELRKELEKNNMVSLRKALSKCDKRIGTHGFLKWYFLTRPIQERSYSDFMYKFSKFYKNYGKIDFPAKEIFSKVFFGVDHMLSDNILFPVVDEIVQYQDFEDSTSDEKQTNRMLYFLNQETARRELLSLDEESKLEIEDFFVDNYTYWFNHFFKKNLQTLQSSSEKSDYLKRIENMAKRRGIDNNMDEESTGIDNNMDEESTGTDNNMDEEFTGIDLRSLSTAGVAPLFYLAKLIVDERWNLSDLKRFGEIEETRNIILENLIDQHRKLCNEKISTFSNYEKQDLLAKILKKNTSLFKNEYSYLLADEEILCKLLSISMFCADLTDTFSEEDLGIISKQIFGKYVNSDSICDLLKKELFREEIEKDPNIFEMNKLLWSLHKTHLDFCQAKVEKLTKPERINKISDVLGKNESLFRKEEFDTIINDPELSCKVLTIALYCANLRKYFSLKEMNEIHNILFNVSLDFSSKENLCDDLKKRLFFDSLKRPNQNTLRRSKRQRLK